MNNLQIFKNDEFGEIRTVTIDNEPWMVGKDVAEVLGYANPRKALADHVDEDDKYQGDGVTIRDSIGREQNPTIINESGLYSLVLSSKLPNAKKFRRWVTSEVLPSIRKTGAYQIPQTTAGQIQLLAQGHMELLEKIETVEKNLQNFKEEMPLLALDCQRITIAKNQKVLDLLGGKTSSAYRNASLRGKVYRDMERQLKREFDVSSYKAIQRNKTDKAIEIIKAYTLPYFLQESVNDANAQIDLSNLQVS